MGMGLDDSHERRKLPSVTLTIHRNNPTTRKDDRMSDTDSGRPPSGQDLVNDAPAGHRPSGFDPSRERGGEFTGKPTATLAAQCRMQARENIDPEYSRFMFAVADRLDGYARRETSAPFPMTRPDPNFQTALSFPQLIEWANEVVNGSWHWCWNSRCKYVTIKLDTRAGAYRIEDRNDQPISLHELFRQSNRDSDGNPKGEDGTASPRSDNSAGLKGMAQ